MAGVPLVRSLIRKINIPDHLLVAHEDLESVGIVGLLQALDNYDPDKARFATHAYRRVRGSIIGDVAIAPSGRTRPGGFFCCGPFPQAGRRPAGARGHSAFPKSPAYNKKSGPARFRAGPLFDRCTSFEKEATRDGR